jgi:hypothetical protein
MCETCTNSSTVPKQQLHSHHTSSPDRPPKLHLLIKNSSGKVFAYVRVHEKLTRMRHYPKSLLI